MRNVKLSVDGIREYVGRLVYKPGWSFSINDNYSDPLGERVSIEVSWEVRDSSADNAPLYLRTLPYPFAATVWLSPTDCPTTVHIARKLLEECVRMEAQSLFHEGREFLRCQMEGEEIHYVDEETGEMESEVRYYYIAPFHPHTLHGGDMWEATHSMQYESNKVLDQG